MLRQDHKGIADLLFSTLVRGTGVLLAFASNLLIARLLGPHQFGRYMTLLSIALVGGALATYGLGPVLTREISRVDSNLQVATLRSDVVWVFRFSGRLSFLVIILVLVWLTVGVGVPVSSWMERVFTVFIIPLSATAILLAGVLSGMLEVARSQAISMIWKNGFILVGISLLLTIGIDRPTDVLLIQVMSFTLAILVALFWSTRPVQGLGAALDKRLVPSITQERAAVLRRDGRHFLAISAAWLVLGRLDVVIVNALSGETQAGYFGAAARLGQFAGMAGLIWVAWLQPRMSECYHGKYLASIRRLIHFGLWGALATTVVLITVGWFSAPHLMNLMGPSFDNAVMPFRWLLLGYLPWAASVPSYAYLSMSGRESRLSRILWLQVVVTIGTSLPLAYDFGALGAAWAWSSGLTVSSVAVIYVSAYYMYLTKKAADA